MCVRLGAMGDCWGKSAICSWFASRLSRPTATWPSYSCKNLPDTVRALKSESDMVNLIPLLAMSIWQSSVFSRKRDII
jgi:hypothetical protein